MGYRRFQIGYLIVEYGLFNTTNFIQNLIYIHFGIILTQFYINFLRQEHQIDVSTPEILSLYTFHFSSTVPLILDPLEIYLYISKYDKTLVNNNKKKIFFKTP